MKFQEIKKLTKEVACDGLQGKNIPYLSSVVGWVKYTRLQLWPWLTVIEFSVEKKLKSVQ